MMKIYEGLELTVTIFEQCDIVRTSPDNIVGEDQLGWE